MSRAARCLGTPLRSLACANAGSTLASARAVVIPGFRRYGHAALHEREEAPYRSESGEYSRPPREFRSRQWGRDGRREEAGLSPAQLRDQAEQQQEYLERLWHPLQFPPELVQRILTHASHRQARSGHNSGFSFIGRRVLSSYYHLFLHASPNLTPSDDIEDIVDRSLNTNLIGEHVGNAWGVGRELVWEPNAPSHRLIDDTVKMEALRSAGLYKVQGEAIQAMIGGIYRQHGGSVALRAFHTRLLPLLLVKGGVPKQFHKEVYMVCEGMGGPTGPLVLEPEQKESSKVETLSS